MGEEIRDGERGQNAGISGLGNMFVTYDRLAESQVCPHSHQRMVPLQGIGSCYARGIGCGCGRRVAAAADRARENNLGRTAGADVKELVGSFRVPRHGVQSFAFAGVKGYRLLSVPRRGSWIE